MKMQSVWLCVGTFLLLQPALSVAFGDTEDADDSGFSRNRRGWSMMRLGRGLQMLRLGKRASPSSVDAAAQSSPEQIRALLASMVEEARNDFRRQPPLPRYGRELDESQDAADDLYSLLGDGVLPLHYQRQMHQGRFKRSAARLPTRFSDPVSEYDQSLDDPRIRAVALPRIGRYLGRLYKIRPGKAVPAPRIGREEMEGLDFSHKQNPKESSQPVKRDSSQFMAQETAASDDNASSGSSGMSL